LILGISASGRSSVRNECDTLTKGVTEEMVKYVLRNTGESFEYISLNGKKILGCQGCLKCASDNVCVLEDDWAEIRDKIFEAEALVFGAPVYYGQINSIGHAFLERTFSLRHRETFKLTGKPNVIITAGTDQPNPAEDYIKMMFRGNYMTPPIGSLRVRGVSQCLTCGYGQTCAAGSVVGLYGYLDEIKDEHFNRIPEESYNRANIIAKRLGSIVRSNRKK